MTNYGVDLSSVISQVLTEVSQWIRAVFGALASIKIVGGVSVLHVLVAITILSMVISAVFVLFDSGVDEE